MILLTNALILTVALFLFAASAEASPVHIQILNNGNIPIHTCAEGFPEKVYANSNRSADIDVPANGQPLNVQYRAYTDTDHIYRLRNGCLFNIVKSKSGLARVNITATRLSTNSRCKAKRLDASSQNWQLVATYTDLNPY
ncbi:MAG: hypothetical protein CMF50_05995 [Legionellales bacterium]|nr:hypothetical protein [Legionellales bacterium]|tara:strand:- start:85573 stop:85992 length:420 start_codon:yes stop_codon:yes gene_type:complete